MMDGSLPGLQSFHGDLHKRILTDLNEIDTAEIEKPSRFLEDEPMSLRFRMHRFDSHMRRIQSRWKRRSKGLVTFQMNPSDYCA